MKNSKNVCSAMSGRDSKINTGQKRLKHPSKLEIALIEKAIKHGMALYLDAVVCSSEIRDMVIIGEETCDLGKAWSEMTVELKKEEHSLRLKLVFDITYGAVMVVFLPAKGKDIASAQTRFVNKRGYVDRKLGEIFSYRQGELELLGTELIDTVDHVPDGDDDDDELEPKEGSDDDLVDGSGGKDLPMIEPVLDKLEFGARVITVYFSKRKILLERTQSKPTEACFDESQKRQIIDALHDTDDQLVMVKLIRGSQSEAFQLTDIHPYGRQQVL